MSSFARASLDANVVTVVSWAGVSWGPEGLYPSALSQSRVSEEVILEWETGRLTLRPASVSWPEASSNSVSEGKALPQPYPFFVVRGCANNMEGVIKPKRASLMNRWRDGLHIELKWSEPGGARIGYWTRSTRRCVRQAQGRLRILFVGEGWHKASSGNKLNVLSLIL